MLVEARDVRVECGVDEELGVVEYVRSARNLGEPFTTEGCGGGVEFVETDALLACDTVRFMGG